MCLFYLLLLSSTEVIPFGWAYLLSSVATIGLITAYTYGFAKRQLPHQAVKASLQMGGLLGILYIYLYILLNMEDYALLAGTLGLFAALAAIMYVTRGINWYGNSAPAAEITL